MFARNYFKAFSFLKNISDSVVLVKSYNFSQFLQSFKFVF